jgi:hypothetical protein
MRGCRSIAAVPVRSCPTKMQGYPKWTPLCRVGAFGKYRCVKENKVAKSNDVTYSKLFGVLAISLATIFTAVQSGPKKTVAASYGLQAGIQKFGRRCSLV